MKSLVSLAVVLLAVGTVEAAVVADFDDLSLAADSSWSGNYTIDGTGGTYDTAYFVSGSATFENHSDGDWYAWGGLAYSNRTDTVSSGYTNQFSAYAGQAQSGSNFAIGYQDAFNGFKPTVILDSPMQVSGLYVTNTTYTALDMQNGSMFSKKFGGLTGNDPDWLLLTITGKNGEGASVGVVQFYLADYRFSDNSQDYIVDVWEYVDLTSLGAVGSLEFTVDSSDHSIYEGVDYGMNTPSYFALDTIVPEPATLMLLGMGGLVLRMRK